LILQKGHQVIPQSIAGGWLVQEEQVHVAGVQRAQTRLQALARLIGGERPGLDGGVRLSRKDRAQLRYLAQYAPGQSVHHSGVEGARRLDAELGGDGDGVSMLPAQPAQHRLRRAIAVVARGIEVIYASIEQLPEDTLLLRGRLDRHESGRSEAEAAGL